MPAVVLPFHDPRGLYLPHLRATTPQLKRLFSRPFLSVSPATEQDQASALAAVREDPFFCLNGNLPGSGPGDHYRAAYASAVAHSVPGDSLHLCDIDKLACYLQGHGPDREALVADLERASAEERPVFFQRSPAAWRTYPRHYREIERRAMRAAAAVFGGPIDIAWSHLTYNMSVAHPTAWPKGALTMNPARPQRYFSVAALLSLYLWKFRRFPQSNRRTGSLRSILRRK